MYRKLILSCLIGIFNFTYIPTAFSAEVETAKYVPQDLSDRQVSSLASELCMAIANAHVSSDFELPKKLEASLLKFSKINASTPDYRLKIARFWNHYSPNMICSADSGLFPTQHLFKRALAMDMQKMVLENYFFADEIAFPIDVNTIEIESDGSAETALDYIDLILSSPKAAEKYNVGQVAGIRDILVDLYGGKRANEMSPIELARRTARIKKYDPLAGKK